MPSRLIHDEDGVGVFCHMAGDFGQMLGHGVCVAPRHDESGCLAVLRADRSEDVGRSRALIVLSVPEQYMG